MDRDGGASLRVFGAIGPGIGAAITDDVSWFERDGRIVRSVEALWPSQTDAQAPRLTIILSRALDEQKDGIVGGLRGGRPGGWLLRLGWLRRRRGGRLRRSLLRLGRLLRTGFLRVRLARTQRSREKDGRDTKKKPCQRGLSHAESSRRNRIPCEGAANNPDERAV